MSSSNFNRSGEKVEENSKQEFIYSKKDTYVKKYSPNYIENLIPKTNTIQNKDKKLLESGASNSMKSENNRRDIPQVFSTNSLKVVNTESQSNISGSHKSKHKEKQMKTLVLDLDETLVHSSFTPLSDSNFSLKIEVEGESFLIYVRIRPGTEEFLKKMAEIYEVVIFTASIKIYADLVIDKIDPRKLVSYRLYRTDCKPHNEILTKDLSVCERDLSDVILIDNSPSSYVLQPENALPILTWIEDLSDKELDKLIPILERLAKVADVRKFIPKFTKDHFINHKEAMDIFLTLEIKDKLNHIESKIEVKTPIKSEKKIVNNDSRLSSNKARPESSLLSLGEGLSKQLMELQNKFYENTKKIEEIHNKYLAAKNMKNSILTPQGKKDEYSKLPATPEIKQNEESKSNEIQNKGNNINRSPNDNPPNTVSNCNKKNNVQSNIQNISSLMKGSSLDNQQKPNLQLDSRDKINESNSAVVSPANNISNQIGKLPDSTEISKNLTENSKINRFITQKEEKVTLSTPQSNKAQIVSENISDSKPSNGIKNTSLVYQEFKREHEKLQAFLKSILSKNPR